MLTSRMRIVGHVVAELFDSEGRLKQRQEVHNLVTDYGDQYAATRLHGGAITAMAGMKLGTATTLASKNGAGSFVAVADYVSGSAHALDPTYPKQGAAVNVAQYKVTWVPSESTANNINRVGLVDNTTNAGEADATHTMATAVFDAAINKSAADTLAVTWNFAITGS